MEPIQPRSGETRGGGPCSSCSSTPRARSARRASSRSEKALFESLRRRHARRRLRGGNPRLRRLRPPDLHELRHPSTAAPCSPPSAREIESPEPRARRIDRVLPRARRESVARPPSSARRWCSSRDGLPTDPVGQARSATRARVLDAARTLSAVLRRHRSASTPCRWADDPGRCRASLSAAGRASPSCGSVTNRSQDTTNVSRGPRAASSARSSWAPRAPPRRS